MLEGAAGVLDKRTVSDVGVGNVQVDPRTGEGQLTPRAGREEFQQRLQTGGRFRDEKLRALERSAEVADEQTVSDVDVGDVQLDPQTLDVDLTPRAREREIETQVGDRLVDEQVNRATELFGAPDPELREGIAAQTDVEAETNTDGAPEITVETRALGPSDTQLPGQREAAIDALERQVGAQRADRAGLTGGRLRRDVVARTELTPGEDVTVTPTDDGLRAEPTPGLLEEEAERALQQRTGLDPREDFSVNAGRVTEGEAELVNRGADVLGFEGGVEAGIQTDVNLTEEGQRELTQQRADDALDAGTDIATDSLNAAGRLGQGDLSPFGDLSVSLPDVEEREQSDGVGVQTQALGAAAALPGALGDEAAQPGPGGVRGGEIDTEAGPQRFVDAAFGVREASNRGEAFAEEEFVAPVARTVGQGGDALTLDEEAIQEPGPDTAVGQDASDLTRFLGEGAATVFPGGGAEVVNLGVLGAGSAEFTAEAVREEGAVEGGATAASAAGGFLATTGARTARAFRENPTEFTTRALGSAGVGTFLTPLRVARFDVPLRETSRVEADVEGQRAAEGIDADVDAPAADLPDAPPTSTAVRGVRLQTPLALEQVGVRTRGRTVLGARGVRPTVGAPSVAPLADDLDLARIGASSTGAVEPGNAFEADVVRATTAGTVAGDAQRFGTAEGLQTEAQRRADTGFTAESAEEAIGQARAVPEDAVEDVTQTLRDLDATVFGSAAARAQLEDFRQPRDIDIVVDDKRSAVPELFEAIEGERPTDIPFDEAKDRVGDVFDIKETSEVPGRARGGETIKFGRTSREPQELGGVPFNPVEEELVRKAGASAFLRQPGAAGTDELDIGPEPRRPGRTDVRRKDPEDAAAMARELGLAGRGVEEFEDAFGLTDRPRDTPSAEAGGGLFGAADDPLALRALAADERAQLGAGRRRFGADVDADTPRAGTRGAPEAADGPGSPPGRGPGRADSDSPARSSPSRSSPGASPAASPGVGTPASGGLFDPVEPQSPAADPGLQPTGVGSPAADAPMAGSPAVFGDLGGVVGSPGAADVEDGVTPSPADAPGDSPPGVGAFGPPVSPADVPADGTPFTFDLPSPGASGGVTTPFGGEFALPFTTLPGVSEPAPRRPRDGSEPTDPDKRELPIDDDPRATPLFSNPVLDVFGGVR
jgi:hypothetical protein